MASIQPRYGFPGKRRSYTAAEAIVGGQLVERRSGTNLIGVAAAASAKCAGVALDDDPATAAWIGGPAIGQGNELTSFWGGEVAVTYAAAATEGQKLVCAALGQVTPYIIGTHDPSLIVGACQVATAMGAVGFAWINPVGI